MKRITRLSAILLCTTLPVVFSSATLADNYRFRQQHVAKFVCGADPQPAFVRVVPGFYATTVAIQNIDRRTADIRMRVSLSFPPPVLAPGPVSADIETSLEPGAALQVDCAEIFGIPGSQTPDGNPVFSTFFPGMAPGVGFPPYIQGFVTIETRRRLEVAAVYTAADGTLGEDLVVRSIDTERIPARRAR